MIKTMTSVQKDININVDNDCLGDNVDNCNRDDSDDDEMVMKCPQR